MSEDHRDCDMAPDDGEGDFEREWLRGTAACDGRCVPCCDWCLAGHDCPADCGGGDACPYTALRDGARAELAAVSALRLNARSALPSAAPYAEAAAASYGVTPAQARERLSRWKAEHGPAPEWVERIAALRPTWAPAGRRPPRTARGVGADIVPYPDDDDCEETP